MIRDLVTSIIPMNPHSTILVMGATPYPLINEYFMYYLNMTNLLVVTFLVAVLQFPKSHVGRRKVLPSYVGLSENCDFHCCTKLVCVLAQWHMNLSINLVFVSMSLYHLGTMVGSLMSGLTGKYSRKYSMVLVQILEIAVLLVFVFFSRAVLLTQLPLEARTYVIYGQLGSRKIRSLIPPALAKDITNTLGFDGTFSLDYQRMCLIMIFMGFAAAINGVAKTSLLDTSTTEFQALTTFYTYGVFYFGFGNFIGSAVGFMAYNAFDVDGAFITLVIFKGILLLVVLIEFLESKGCDSSWKAQQTQCFVKSIYFGCYMCPQGGFQDSGQQLLAHMVDHRYRFNKCSAGWITGYRQKWARVGLVLFWISFVWFHMPVIGTMFWLACFGGSWHYLYASLSMDMVNVHDQANMENFMLTWCSIYPVFLASYVKPDDMTIILSVCESMWHLGNFMSISRWPGQLLCVDPMNCWRSQYLYSHGIFYDCGSNAGNLSYVNWYLFVKSQRRQCCCPYRKLKADAPDKCCPPCCLGPLVEETGGCPCPCCCASCAG